MSLRFIYGKSGTGKTSLCFDKINNLIKENKKIYIITPEQFSFSAEKHLMNVLDSKAIMCAEVITFKRIAHRIINSEGNEAKENITNCGKAMLLSYIMEKQKNNLKFLGKTDKNLDLILRMITELKKNNIDNKVLAKSKEEIEDKYIKLKLDDISILYDEFNNTINGKYLNDDDLLSIVKEKICKSNMFKDAYVFIDEFAGFTKQEYSIIEELIKEANEVDITICTDSIDVNCNPDTDIFAANKKTVQKLKEIALKNNVKIIEPIKLEKIYRFKSNELEYLSNNLYNINPSKYLEDSNNIRLFLANNNYTEIEYVANNIIELVRDKDYRYKDISVITKNTEDYSSLIKSIFRKYNIPVFIDEKKDLNQNILVKYIIALLEIYSKSFSMEAVINYIKTGFVDLEDEEIFEFENYCKRSGINGIKKFSNKFEVKVDKNSNIEELNYIKDKIINPLLKLKENLNRDKTIKDITLEIYTFLEKNNIRNILQNKIAFFEKSGNIELANIYNTSWDLLIDILDELVLVLGNEKISFENYINLFKVGINNSSLGKIPATLDEVIVGDVDRSRSEDKKAVFIIGLNDGKFPSNSKNEGFINDEERIYLREKGLELAKTTKEQLYDENFNIYKAFSVAEERLFLSYSASDNDGKGLRKSILLNKIKKIFPKLKEQSDIIEQKTYISSKDVTFDLLLLNLRKYLDGEKIDDIWFRIYDIYMKDRMYNERLITALNGFDYTNIPDNLNQDNIQKLYGDSLETSISKLESYRRCPFSYYLKYGLKLSENTELKLQNMDTGTFMHEVIDEFFITINKEKLNLKEMSEEEIEQIVKEIVDNKLKLSENYVFNAIPKYIVLSKRLKKVIIKAIKYIVKTLKYSDFNVLNTEAEFGTGKNYDPIEVNLENGKRVQIIGKIDRIDIAENKDGKYIRIIDYKSSIKNIDLNEVVAGIQIQLLTYLDAVSKKEEAIPAGTLYFSLIDPVIKAKNKHLTSEQLEQEIRNNFKMNGLILGDVNVVKMMDNNLVNGNSNIVPAYIDKEGNLSKNKPSILEKGEFEKLQIKIEKVIKEISQDILSGQIQQKPIYLYKNKKTACDYCNFKAICGFNPKMLNNNYNYVPNASKTEILEKL